jgi:hypothetical protein
LNFVRDAAVKVRKLSETKHQRGRGPSIQSVDVADLAGVADALLADGRSDLAAQIILVMYYCAERQAEVGNVIPFRDHSRGGG